VDERTLDTIAKRDELRGLLGGSDAERLVKAARAAMVALEFRVQDPMLGLPPVDRDLLLEVHALLLQAVERAADLGSDEAALWLGDIRYDAEDVDGAMALFEAQAEAGHPLGAAKAAELIRRLERADRYADVLRWLDAALARDPNGMVHYVRGLYAFNGLGCPADRAAAFRLHEEAAARGNADAMFELYAMLAQGVGCAADPARAVDCCVQAAEGGNVRAMANLGGMYATGNGLPQDSARSVEWYARAAEKGHGRAAASLGCMYALGQEIEGDERKARWYFARAEALGYDWRPMATTMGLEVGEWE
jgi:TPR repeat protein